MKLSYWWLFDHSPPLAIVESKLYDRYHDISLLIEIDMTKQSIQSIEVEERRTPFGTCPGAISQYNFLKDVKFNKPALDIAISFHIPESKMGCIRISQLLYFAAEHFVSAVGYELKKRQIPEIWNEEIHTTNSMPFVLRSKAVHQWWIQDRIMKNSCYTMREGQTIDPDGNLALEPTISSLLIGMRKRN